LLQDKLLGSTATFCSPTRGLNTVYSVDRRLVERSLITDVQKCSKARTRILICK